MFYMSLSWTAKSAILDSAGDDVVAPSVVPRDQFVHVTKTSKNNREKGGIKGWMSSSSLCVVVVVVVDSDEGRP